MNDADITILGGGPVGSALALLLAQHAVDPSRIVLCRTSPPAPAAGAADPRALALNHGSRLLLQRLGAWPEGGAAIDTIHVSQRARLGRTLIRREDFGVPELGSVHAYDRVQAVLHAAVDAAGVSIREGRAVIAGETPADAALTAQDTASSAAAATSPAAHARPGGAERAADRPVTAPRRAAGGVLIAQADATWRTAVAVQAEGAVDAPESTLEGKSRPGVPAVIARDYDQHAVLALVRASQPQPGWAWERFTREGPLALLPVRHGEDAQDTYSLVWCCAPPHARALAAMDDAAFGQALTAAFGDRLGALTAVTARQVYPLRLRWRREPVQGRRVAIGNAAQTLHPVAGQGLNLGLRDAEQLAQALRGWLRQPSTDPTPVLAAFARTRRADRTVTAGLTDLLPRVFASGVPLVEHACGLALLALDTIPALRRPLARQLMQGLRG